MKSYKLSSYVNLSLLLSSLVILSSCDWIQKKTCDSCPKDQLAQDQKTEEQLTGQVLLGTSEKPLITTESFEDFWNMYAEGNPQAALIVSLHPGIKYEMFKNTLKPLEIAKLYVEKEGKASDPEYKRKLKKQFEFFEKALALETLKEDVLKNIDKSDAALEQFYKEYRDKVSVFQHAPFVKTPAGTKATIVEFDKEQAADAFLEKAKAEGANFSELAKSVGKSAKDLGFVSNESKDVDPAIIVKLNETKPNEVVKVNIGKDKFAVVKALSKREADYLPYSEIKNNPELKEALEQAIVQTKGSEFLNKKLEDLTEKYGIKENKEYFEKEIEQKQADLESKLKELQAQMPAEESGEETKDITE